MKQYFIYIQTSIAMSCAPGQRRSRVTGHCRKPCANHQAINPATGRCVTKNYLRKIQRGCYGPSDTIYRGSLSGKDYRDGLVPDRSCYPRKRNIYTGHCKTPCGRGRAINPRTGNCVTLSYLRSLNPCDYDTDDDDLMTADILFTPTDLATGHGIVHASYDNEVTKRGTGFSSNQLRENDLTIMASAYNSAKETNRQQLSGAYSSEARRDNCSEKKKFNAEMFTECGLREVGSNFDDLVRKFNNLNENVFVFHVDTSSQLGTNMDILGKLIDAAKNNPVRVLIPDYYGVWRWLIPKTADDAQLHSLEATMHLIIEKVNAL